MIFSTGLYEFNSSFRDSKENRPYGITSIYFFSFEVLNIFLFQCFRMWIKSEQICKFRVKYFKHKLLVLLRKYLLSHTVFQKLFMKYTSFAKEMRLIVKFFEKWSFELRFCLQVYRFNLYICVN